jgi:flagellin
MSLRINHNIAAINGHRQMQKNDMAVSKSLEKLSSGLRINRASDDAAGLVVSEQMRAQIGGLGQAIRNSETAVSMMQTAEGAMDEINTLLLKARDLALHATNEGANDQNQLSADQAELDNIVDSVNRIANYTQFGTKKILDGGLSNAKSNDARVGSVSFGGQYLEDLANSVSFKGYHTLFVTATASKAITAVTISGSDIIESGAANTLFSLSGMALTEEFQKAFTLNIGGGTVAVSSGTTKAQFVQQLNAIGASLGFTAVVSTGNVANGTASGTALVIGIGQVAIVATDFGTRTFGVQFAGGATGAQSVLGTIATGGADMTATVFFNTGAEGGVATTGGASSVLALTGNGLNLTSVAVTGAGFFVQITANIASGTVMYGAIDGTTSGATFQIGANVGQQATVALNSVKAGDLGRGASGSLSSLDALKGSALIIGKGGEALKVIDKAIDSITVQRGRLGAFQKNTLESGISSLSAAQENLTAAESVIRDVDFAAESANFTKNNILVQAATAMLAQANQLPQNVLSLLAR